MQDNGEEGQAISRSSGDGHLSARRRWACSRWISPLLTTPDGPSRSRFCGHSRHYEHLRWHEYLREPSAFSTGGAFNCTTTDARTPCMYAAKNAFGTTAATRSL